MSSYDFEQVREDPMQIEKAYSSTDTEAEDPPLYPGMGEGGRGNKFEKHTNIQFGNIEKDTNITPYRMVKIVVNDDSSEHCEHSKSIPIRGSEDGCGGGDCGNYPASTLVSGEKIKVVSFSGGRVFDATALTQNNIVVKDKQKYIPLSKAKEFILSILIEMEKLKKQQIDAMSEIEWNFHVMEQSWEKIYKQQIDHAKDIFITKITALHRQLSACKLKLKIYEEENNNLTSKFEERVKEFKQNMPSTVQELDALYEAQFRELQENAIKYDAEVERLNDLQQTAYIHLIRTAKELGIDDKYIDNNLNNKHNNNDSSFSLLSKITDFCASLIEYQKNARDEEIQLFTRSLVYQISENILKQEVDTLKQDNSDLRNVLASNGGGEVAAVATASHQEMHRGSNNLQNELMQLRAENFALRKHLAMGDDNNQFLEGGGGDINTYDGGNVELILLRQEITGKKEQIRNLEDDLKNMNMEVEKLKEENELLQNEIISIEQAANSNKKGGGAGGGAGQTAKLLQQAKEKNKNLEQQIERFKTKLREVETKGRPNPEQEQLLKELQIKLKDADIEKKKELKALEMELSKNSKGTETEMKKLEHQNQKLTERAVTAETELENCRSELKNLKKKQEALVSELEALKKEIGDFQALLDEVKQLRQQTKEQTNLLVDLDASYREEKRLRKKYYNEIEDMKGKIRVYCRVRPMAKYELEKGCKQTVFPIDEYSCKVVTNKGDKEFVYDRVFDWNTAQNDVYEDTERLIQSVLDGFNVCIFAYGQTGSGKTFTIQGNQANPGIAPRAIRDLFGRLRELENGKFKYEVEVYMTELYNNQLIDLLASDELKKNPPCLEIKKDSSGIVRINGISLKKVENEEQLLKIFAFGLDARHVSGTAMNAESSRSHLIFSVMVRLEDLLSQKRTLGKLSLIDLAGSERVSKSGVTKERLIEAKEINKSLSALGDVISALSTGESFVPYRNHKLTQVMSDSLGGSAKTLMFVNISPADYNTDETVTSLMYASRVKTITNDASKQVESKQVSKLKDQVKKLLNAVEAQQRGEKVDINQLKKFDTMAGDGDDVVGGEPSSRENDDDANYEEPEDIVE